jgi:ABC-type lipoprotein release transport system permease subunit
VGDDCLHVFLASLAELGIGGSQVDFVFTDISCGLTGTLCSLPSDQPDVVRAVSLLLAAVALLACLAPTRRAIAVDPTVVLRCE